MLAVSTCQDLYVLQSRMVDGIPVQYLQVMMETTNPSMIKWRVFIQMIIYWMVKVFLLCQAPAGPTCSSEHITPVCKQQLPSSFNYSSEIHSNSSKIMWVKQTQCCITDSKEIHLPHKNTKHICSHKNKDHARKSVGPSLLVWISLSV